MKQTGKVQKAILLEMLEQNKFTSSFSLNQINSDNANFRLNEKTASVGFIYRHIGETTNTFAQFLGVKTDIVNTTLAQTDTGKKYDVETSRAQVKQGYLTLEKLINETPDEDWLAKVDTPFFGTITKIRLFAHTLYHISHHCGQISSAIAKGKAYEMKKEEDGGME